VRHQQVVAREAAAAALEIRSFPSGEDEMLSGELETAIRQAIDEMPEKPREVFQLSREQGLKYIEIASALDISVKTVEKRMGQALAHLRDKLAAWL
jgi:RNA polymerase sigma-70 factor (ECF subfamily)